MKPTKVVPSSVVEADDTSGTTSDAGAASDSKTAEIQPAQRVVFLQQYGSTAVTSGSTTKALPRMSTASSRNLKAEATNTISRALNRQKAGRLHLADVVKMAMEHERSRCTLGALFCPCYLCIHPRSRKRLTEAQDHAIYLMLNFVLTIYTLFADDILRAFLPKTVDIWFEGVIVIAFVYFTVDLAIQSSIDRRIIFSFFWWLDVVATISLLLDVPLIMTEVLRLFGAKRVNVSVTQLGAAAAAGSSVGQMLRVLRIMRLLRMLRLFRAFQRFKPLAKRLLQRALDCVCGTAPPTDPDGSDAEEALEENTGRRKKRKSRRRSMVRILPQRRMSSVGEQAESSQSRVGRRITRLIRMKVMAGVMLIILLAQLLEYSTVDNVPERELSRLEKWRADQTVTGVAIYNELHTGFRDIYPTLLELSLWNGTHTEVLLADTEDKMAELRDPEILSVVSSSGLSSATIDKAEPVRRASMMAFLQTQLIVLLLGLQAVMLTRDVNRLLVRPIERIGEYLRPVWATAIKNLSHKGEDPEDSGWRQTLSKNDGEEISTKLMLASIECLRRDLNPAAKREFARKSVVSALRRDKGLEQRVSAARDSTRSEFGSLRFDPISDEDYLSGKLRSRTSVIPFFGLGQVSEAAKSASAAVAAIQAMEAAGMGEEEEEEEEGELEMEWAWEKADRRESEASTLSNVSAAHTDPVTALLDSIDKQSEAVKGEEIRQIPGLTSGAVLRPSSRSDSATPSSMTLPGSSTSSEEQKLRLDEEPEEGASTSRCREGPVMRGSECSAVPEVQGGGISFQSLRRSVTGSGAIPPTASGPTTAEAAPTVETSDALEGTTGKARALPRPVMPRPTAGQRRRSSGIFADVMPGLQAGKEYMRSGGFAPHLPSTTQRRSSRSNSGTQDSLGVAMGRPVRATRTGSLTLLPGHTASGSRVPAPLMQGTTRQASMPALQILRRLPARAPAATTRRHRRSSVAMGAVEVAQSGQEDTLKTERSELLSGRAILRVATPPPQDMLWAGAGISEEEEGGKEEESLIRSPVMSAASVGGEGILSIAGSASLSDGEWAYDGEGLDSEDELADMERQRLVQRYAGRRSGMIPAFVATAAVLLLRRAGVRSDTTDHLVSEAQSAVHAATSRPSPTSERSHALSSRHSIGEADRSSRRSIGEADRSSRRSIGEADRSSRRFDASQSQASPRHRDDTDIRVQGGSQGSAAGRSRSREVYQSDSDEDISIAALRRKPSHVLPMRADRP